MLSEEQAEKIKKQIIGQIEKTFPQDKKEFAISQIESMNSEHLEAFLKQNKLIKTKGQANENSTGCVFCSIVSNQISSFKISENKDSIAVLEINPISKGHALIIPKDHVTSSDKLKKSVFSLAKEITNRIKTKLEPKDITIASSNLMGHEMVNIIPIYESETIDSERHQASHEELLDLQKTLEKKQKAIVKRVKKIKNNHANTEKRAWLPKRIP